MANVKLLVLGGVVVAGTAIGFFAPTPSDKELIQQALQDSIKAGREGRPGSVLEMLADSFKVNGQSVGNTAQIAQAIKDYKPRLEVKNMEPKVDGEQATIASPATLSVSVPPMSVDLSEVELNFHKESGRRWLFFPTPVWKLENAKVPAEALTRLGL